MSPCVQGPSLELMDKIIFPVRVVTWVKIMPLGFGTRLLWIFTVVWKWKICSQFAMFAFPDFLCILTTFFFTLFFLILDEVILNILDTFLTGLLSPSVLTYLTCNLRMLLEV